MMKNFKPSEKGASEHSFELGPIRPPSEAYSLLIRVSRNCSWNRCKFCHTYKGEKFELRPVTEIKQDIAEARAIHDEIANLSQQPGYEGNIREAAAVILYNPPSQSYYNVALWLYAGGENVFLQDGNSLILKTANLLEVLNFLKATFPNIKRITSYARSKTAAKKTLSELIELQQAGLSRLHIGLESGYDPILQFMDKGVTAVDHIKGGKNVVASGISLCEYVLLGLGGETWWREHAEHTARVLNEINPDFIRVRTLTVNGRMPVYGEIENGNFIRATDDRIVEEERLLIENLTCSSNFVSDHITNLLQEVEGKLPEDKERLLSVIDRYLSLSPEDKTNFRVGRRAGIYERLSDLSNPAKHAEVKSIIRRLSRSIDEEVDENTIYRLMEKFI